MKTFLAFALFVLMMAPSPVTATDGDLDLTFGTGGKVTTDFDDAIALSLQPDGKMIVAGHLGGVEGRPLGLARYNIDGSLDTTFASEGKLTTDFAGGWRTAVALQSDGKIVVVGNFSSLLTNFALARYNSDGSVDSTFGTAGRVATQFQLALALALQSDGKIVMAGSDSGNRPLLVRYNGDGALDQGFGAGGTVTLGFTGQALAVQSDGKIIVAGFVWISPSYTDFALARYNGDGSLDVTFGTGEVITAFYPNYDYRSPGAAYAVAVQSDGKIVAAGGDLFDESGLRLARYKSDGLLDTSFGIDGKVTTGVDAISLAIQSDEKILIGSFPFGDAAIIRYSNAGSLDGTFGTGGYVSGDGAIALALQSDGKIVSVARSSLVRYNSAHPVMRFEPVKVSLGGSFTATFSGTNMNGQTYFDVRYRLPGDDSDQVALNWQYGLAAEHSVAADTVVGTWEVTGVRPHQSASEHTADFIPVSTAVRVAP
jgi:uncharacterized delta-60 repeat protein